MAFIRTTGRILRYYRLLRLFSKHPNASKLPCDIPYLLGSDFEVLRSVNMDDFKLIDGMDNLTFDKIQGIKVTHETARPVGFCMVTFLWNTN